MTFNLKIGGVVKASFILVSLYLWSGPLWADSDREELGASSRLSVIHVTADEDQKRATYRSFSQETVLNKKEIVRGESGNVSHVLQQVPGAFRQESTQAGLLSGVFVEPDLLSGVAVHNGAGSVSSIQSAMGGTVKYSTLSPEDLLLRNKPSATKLKVSGNSATDGGAQSVQTAARVGKDGALLAGATLRQLRKIESGSSGEQREREDLDFKRRTYLAKYELSSGGKKMQAKIEFSEAESKNASYLPGGDEDVSDYKSGTWEATLKHEDTVSSLSKLVVRSYYNLTQSEKGTHTAYKGIPSTVGTVKDTLENFGGGVSIISLLSANESLSIQSANGFELAGTKIGESDGTDSPYFGESQGLDVGAVSETTLETWNERLIFSLGARFTRHERSSNKLTLQAPARHEDALSGVVGVSYAPFEWVQFSGKYGSSYRAPPVREMYYGTGKAWRCHRPAKSCLAIPNANLTKEHADSREVSVLLQAPHYESPTQMKMTYFEDSIGDYIDHR